jgi:hypothetical protein
MARDWALREAAVTTTRSSVVRLVRLLRRALRTRALVRLALLRLLLPIKPLSARVLLRLLQVTLRLDRLRWLQVRIRSRLAARLVQLRSELIALRLVTAHSMGHIRFCRQVLWQSELVQ